MRRYVTFGILSTVNRLSYEIIISAVRGIYSRKPPSVLKTGEYVLKSGRAMSPFQEAVRGSYYGAVSGQPNVNFSESQHMDLNCSF
jgi:hypothetical protein